MKVLDVESMQSGIDLAIKDIETFYGKISAIQRSVRDFYGLDDALKGKGGNAIRSFYNDCHQPFLIYLFQSMVDYKDTLTEMKNGIESYESNIKGYVSETYLENDVKSGLDKVETKTVELTASANAVLDSVKDLVAITKIDESEVVENVQRGKTKVNDIVEELHLLDEYETSQLKKTKEDLQTMRNYLSEIESKFQSGDLSIENYSVNAIKGIDGYNSIMNNIYGEDSNPKSLNKENIKNLSIKEIEIEKNKLMKNLNQYAQEVLQQAFNELTNGEIDKTEFHSILSVLVEADKDFKEKSDKKQNDLVNGEVIFEGNRKGQHKITKGVEGNLDDLEIPYYKLPYDEYDIHYTIENGNFIIFKDNPNLYYYTQSAEQGKFNYYVAGATNAYAKLFSTYYTKKGLDKIPGLEKVLGKIDPKLIEYGKYGSSWMIKDNIPYVQDIIGAKVPKAGTKEIILYISEDGENWNRAVRFVVEEGKEPNTTKFHPNSW